MNCTRTILCHESACCLLSASLAMEMEKAGGERGGRARFCRILALCVCVCVRVCVCVCVGERERVRLCCVLCVCVRKTERESTSEKKNKKKQTHYNHSSRKWGKQIYKNKIIENAKKNLFSFPSLFSEFRVSFWGFRVRSFIATCRNRFYL
jgi:hypothetical protein